MFSESCFAKGICLEIYKKNCQRGANEGPSWVKRKKKNPRWFLAHRHSAKCPGMETIWTNIFPPHQTKCKLENRKNTPPHTELSQDTEWLKGGNFAQCRRKWGSTGTWECRATGNSGNALHSALGERKGTDPAECEAREDCLAKGKKGKTGNGEISIFTVIFHAFSKHSKSVQINSYLLGGFEWWIGHFLGFLSMFKLMRGIKGCKISSAKSDG